MLLATDLTRYFVNQDGWCLSFNYNLVINTLSDSHPITPF